MHNDKLNAFVPGEKEVVLPYKKGKLSSLTFAAKELYSIKGFVTGCGNPHWKNTHEPAIKTAPSIEVLLNEGATMVGKTISDEMAFSLNGENAHYGTPLNHRCPDRIPGGSSSGSASAVAAGLVDFALGTDTAGSIRIPASYCGIYGFRPSHGVISTEGIHPMASSFDVVGWFSQSPDILASVGGVLLNTNVNEIHTSKFLIVKDLFDCMEPEIRKHYDSIINKLKCNNLSVIEIELGKPDFTTWIEVLRNIQWWELNQAHGDWISANISTFGAEVRGRLEKIPSVKKIDYEKYYKKRGELIAYINDAIPMDTIAILPTSPDFAPLKGRSIAEARAFRAKVMRNICISTVAGLPQISIPILNETHRPLGLSMIAAKGQDARLLSMAQSFSSN